MSPHDQQETSPRNANESAACLAVSLAPLSFEEAVRALAATPPITEKPHHQPENARP
jgi:hypothetical protein